MSLLNDNDLRLLVANEESPLITGLRSESPQATNTPDPTDPIQPASVDLHAGSIFVPSAESGEPGSAGKGKESVILTTGQSVIISTLESLQLPLDIGAIATPPTSLSFKGVLLLNTGHVDPGYKGKLRVIILNMGRQPIEIRKSDTIITVLFFRLTGSASRGYPAVSSDVTQDSIARISEDFLDVDARARRRARAEAVRSVRGAKFFTGVATLVAGAIAVLAGILPQFMNRGWSKEAEGINARLGAVEKLLEVQDLARRVKVLEASLGRRRGSESVPPDHPGSTGVGAQDPTGPTR